MFLSDRMEVPSNFLDVWLFEDFAQPFQSLDGGVREGYHLTQLGIVYDPVQNFAFNASLILLYIQIYPS